MTSRERVLAAFENKPMDRVPFSFWFHVLQNENAVDGVANPALMDESFEGHRRFVQTVQPDFVKIMCDGLFGYPGIDLRQVRTVKDLSGLREVDDNDPWLLANVRHVARVVSIDPDLCYFYNVFSPSMLLRIFVEEEVYFQLFREDPEKLSEALAVMGRSIAKMSRAVIQSGGADGVFFCAQNTNIGKLTDEEYARYLAPSDRLVLDAANKVSDNNILHVCGYEGRHNHLQQWAAYPSKAVNWASNVEGVGISEGRRIFCGRAAIAGFENTARGILYTGGKPQIEAATDTILADAGMQGFLLGADCSLPHDIDWQHLVWVRQRLEALAKE